MAIDLKQIQNTINYSFQNVDLLQQAFVRRSYSEENGGQNNEILEFIGDKALDLAVIRIMMKRFGEITSNKPYQELKLRNPKYFKTKLKEGQFTDIKKDLVQKKSLARCMDALGFHTQLIMGKGDLKGNIEDEDSVKEDLFEAIIGAVTIDCNWDMDNITNVVETMIDFDAYFEHEEDENYVGLVQEWSQQNGYGLPYYYYRQTYNGFDCYLTINDGRIINRIVGSGESQAKARMDAAYNAYCYLQEQGYILNEYMGAVGEPDENEALRQMNELVQKELINKPEYVFTKYYDDNGDTLWDCKCMLEGYDDTFGIEYYSKKGAQRQAAYNMLCQLMDIEFDDEFSNNNEEDDD